MKPIDTYMDYNYPVNGWSLVHRSNRFIYYNDVCAVLPDIMRSYTRSSLPINFDNSPII
jgi:hypothetical protein